ncbi:hypothetical protein BV898_00562 [Hypsibius exemplaris]|uniref:Receptor ligand binding region domain-containing protein n=1 Tax=Hypsibius exemplaris TaxID=2072580 RepID=A0A1W0XDS3_HYPEX|nr:hypothetical protein BV898_00562 [Hypsibius exemplaris]
MAYSFSFARTLLFCGLCLECSTVMIGAVVPNFVTLTSSGPTPSGFVELQPVFDVMLGILAPKYPAVLGKYTLKQLNHSTPGSCNELECGVIALYGDALVALLQKLNWTSIAVINDANIANPGMAKSREVCRGVTESLQMYKQTISLLIVPTDLSLEKPDRSLLVASNFTRIIVSCTLGATQRILLAAAHDLNMTDGDHIFFHFYEIETPGDFQLAWYKNDSLDQKVARAMLSTIIVRSPQIAWERINDTMSLIQKQKVSRFGGLFPRLTLERNEFQVSCAEAVEGAVMVLNDSCTNGSDSCASGKFLAANLLNGSREYNFPSRTVRLTSKGARVITAIIQQLSSTDLKIKDIFQYDSNVRKLIPDAKNQFIWLMSGHPPPDRPLCGLHNDLCPDNRTIMAIVVAFVGGGALAAIAFLIIVWRTKRVPEDWWLMGDVNFIARLTDGRRFSQMEQKYMLL